MTSYINRLAEELCLPVYVLIRELIRPTAGFFSAAVPSHSNSVDNGERASLAWVTAVEALTRMNGLSTMTLGPVSSLCTTRNEGRPYLCYCQQCLEASVDEEGGCFIPLVWSLRSYSVCLKHFSSLIDRCPYCGNSLLRVFFPNGRNGCCSSCRRWLGSKASSQPEPVDNVKLELSLCAAELVAFSCSTVPAVDVHGLIASLLHERLDANVSTLTRVMDSDIRRVVQILLRRQPPSIAEWMAISNCAHCSVTDLLTAPLLPEIAIPNIRIKAQSLMRDLDKSEKKDAHTIRDLARLFVSSLDAAQLLSISKAVSRVGGRLSI